VAYSFSEVHVIVSTTCVLGRGTGRCHILSSLFISVVHSIVGANTIFSGAASVSKFG
jgi:hypothetical protein